jgi:hypothetical protein
MANRYIMGYNPIQDFLFQSMMYDVNLSNKRKFVDIQSAIVIILQNILDNECDIIHLDLEIRGNKNNVKVIGKNIISALWLSGIFPKNVNDTLKRNEYKIDNIIFKYDSNNHKLTYITIINE